MLWEFKKLYLKTFGGKGVKKRGIYQFHLLVLLLDSLHPLFC